MNQVKPLTEQQFEYLMDHQKNMAEKSLPLEKYNLEVKESKIKGAGLGLFTKCKIPQHSIICYYPCDVITAPEVDKFYELGEEVNKDKYSEEEIQRMKYGDYNFNLDPFVCVTTEGFKTNKMYVGNFMNDKGYNIKEDYKITNNNVTIQGLDCVSLIDIEAGEELYYGYGKGYWFAKDEGVEFSRNEKIQKCLG
jgi:hypothetical protein